MSSTNSTTSRIAVSSLPTNTLTSTTTTTTFVIPSITTTTTITATRSIFDTTERPVRTPDPVITPTTTSTFNVPATFSDVISTTTSGTVSLSLSDVFKSVQTPNTVDSDTLTQPTTSTTTEAVPDPASSSSTTSSTSNGHRKTPVAVFVVIGIASLLFICGICFMFYRLRRRRQRGVQRIPERTDSHMSFMDTDPFVCLPPTPTPVVTRSVSDNQGQRSKLSSAVLGSSIIPRWWDTTGNGAPLSTGKPYYQLQPESRSPETSSFLMEKEETRIEDGQGQVLEIREKGLDESSHLGVTMIGLPPRRPPRSPLRNSGRLVRASPNSDSISTVTFESATPLFVPNPTDNRLEGTIPFVQRRTNPL